MTKEWAEVIGSAAWPATVLLVFLLYEKELKSLLKELSDFVKELAVFKAGELAFERRTQKVLAQALEAESSKAETSPSSEPDPPRNHAEANQTSFLQAAEQPSPTYTVQASHRSITPEAMILESWAKFERAAKSVLNKHGIAGKKDWIAALADFVPADVLPTIHEQRKLRNFVAHGGEATPSAADNFEHVTEVLLRVVRISSITAPPSA